MCFLSTQRTEQVAFIVRQVSAKEDLDTNTAVLFLGSWGPNQNWLGMFCNECNNTGDSKARSSKWYEWLYRHSTII